MRTHAYCLNQKPGLPGNKEVRAFDLMGGLLYGFRITLMFPSDFSSKIL
jgi:hypothetical protein